jgi:rRNA maturation endonuclease Nob1
MRIGGNLACAVGAALWLFASVRSAMPIALTGAAISGLSMVALLFVWRCPRCNRWLRLLDPHLCPKCGLRIR